MEQVSTESESLAWRGELVNICTSWVFSLLKLHPTTPTGQTRRSSEILVTSVPHLNSPPPTLNASRDNCVPPLATELSRQCEKVTFVAGGEDVLVGADAAAVHGKGGAWRMVYGGVQEVGGRLWR